MTWYGKEIVLAAQCQDSKFSVNSFSLRQSADTRVTTRRQAYSPRVSLIPCAEERQLVSNITQRQGCPPRTFWSQWVSAAFHIKHALMSSVSSRKSDSQRRQGRTRVKQDPISSLCSIHSHSLRKARTTPNSRRSVSKGGGKPRDSPWS